MGSAIGQLLSAAVGVAISPLPMIALVVMLATPHGRANGIAFVTSWMATLATVGVIMLVIGRGAHAGGKPATWTLWLTLALGVLFALLAVKQWRDRPRPGEAAEPPAWMAKATPKTLRYRILHVPARVVRGQRKRRLKIPTTWPWAAAIVRAFARILALPRPT
ncbi:GAP family protein [Streptomyces sp. NPDC020192]|uniref:GAP family protein n=1 Tax=Streptomyces sp. NPDC020192 TaxID=3365066 RepID=UPI0037AF695E